MQRQLKGLLNGNFEFRSTRKKSRIVTKVMAAFQTSDLTSKAKTSHAFTFYPNSQKPMKTVIWHRPFTTLADDILDGLVDLGFDVISIKRMSDTRRTPGEETYRVNLPLFFITLPRTSKSQEIFNLAILCHIVIKVG
jgi:hypothetical protein